MPEICFEFLQAFLKSAIENVSGHFIILFSIYLTDNKSRGTLRDKMPKQEIEDRPNLHKGCLSVRVHRGSYYQKL